MWVVALTMVTRERGISGSNASYPSAQLQNLRKFASGLRTKKNGLGPEGEREEPAQTQTSWQRGRGYRSFVLPVQFSALAGKRRWTRSRYAY
jgi:hypothetical protein